MTKKLIALVRKATETRNRLSMLESEIRYEQDTELKTRSYEAGFREGLIQAKEDGRVQTLDILSAAQSRIRGKVSR